MQFYEEDGTGIGGIDISFTDPPNYQIGYCTDDIDFTMLEDEVTWTITKTDVSIAILSNDEELINLLLSESTLSDCVPSWSRDAVSIKFDSGDTASDMYRALSSAGKMALPL